MNNFEKATIEEIYNLLPKDNVTKKEFIEAMKKIYIITKQFIKN
jgi:hypothetical protein